MPLPREGDLLYLRKMMRSVFIESKRRAVMTQSEED